MDYQDCLKIWKKERESTSLSEIPKDLYISLDGFLTKLNREIQDLEANNLAKEILDRLMFIRKDIAQLRMTKITNLVINNVIFDESVLTWGEQRLVRNLRQSIETIGVEKPNILDTIEVSSGVDQYENSEAELAHLQQRKVKKPSDLDYSVVRMLDDVEAFLGLDNLTYGPLEKQDIVHLPTLNATALISRGVARLIKIESQANGDKL